MTDIIDSIRSNIQYEVDRMEFYLKNRQWIDDLNAFADELEGTLTVYKSSTDLSFHGPMGKLYGAVERLNEMGYTTGKELPEQTESYWLATFYRGEERVCISFSNPFCERVQVGTKVEEVPIYEIRCTGEDNE